MSDVDERTTVHRSHGIHDWDRRRVTWLELFFDLVFVVAVARLGALLHDDHSAHGVVAFAGLLVTVWWLWNSFSYFADLFDDDGVIHRIVHTRSTTVLTRTRMRTRTTTGCRMRTRYRSARTRRAQTPTATGSATSSNCRAEAGPATAGAGHLTVDLAQPPELDAPQADAALGGPDTLPGAQSPPDPGNAPCVEAALGGPDTAPSQHAPSDPEAPAIDIALGGPDTSPGADNDPDTHVRVVDPPPIVRPSR